MLAVDVAHGIVERELEMKIHGRVEPGPADNSIYSMENGMSVGKDMAKEFRIDGKKFNGVYWTWADKRPGSRVAGWELLRTYMDAAKPKRGLPRESPGLFVFEDCKQFIRTVPVLARDEKNMDDIDTNAEDHICDEVRYRVRSGGKTVGGGKVRGMH